MRRARVEFCQDKGERVDGRWKRITVEWKQLEGEGVGGDGRQKAEPTALALPCSAWLPAWLERREGGRTRSIDASSLLASKPQSFVVLAEVEKIVARSFCTAFNPAVENQCTIFYSYTEAVMPGVNLLGNRIGTGLSLC